MYYMKDFEKVQKRYKEFWANENERPILLLSAVKEKGKNYNIKQPESLMDRWLDTEHIIKTSRAQFENTIYVAEKLPQINPNLGPDLFGATFGADIMFEETTSYSVPFIKDWTERLEFSEDNKWWQKICKMTDDFVNDAKGDYFVGITDLHPGVDGLVSLRGPEQLCMDIFDSPEAFEHSSKTLLPAFKKQFSALCDITERNIKGTSNWMGLYNESRWYVTSADFICMISPDNFNLFVLPELLEEIKFLNNKTIFHLDGPGALKHLDALLEIPELAGVQWVYGAGQPSAKHWIDVLKKIQNAGKLINIGLKPDDIDVVFGELKPQGLSCYFEFPYEIDEHEANAIIKKAEQMYKNKY